MREELMWAGIDKERMERAVRKCESIKCKGGLEKRVSANDPRECRHLLKCYVTQGILWDVKEEVLGEKVEQAVPLPAKIFWMMLSSRTRNEAVKAFESAKRRERRQG